jgi:hypothetical protein
VDFASEAAGCRPYLPGSSRLAGAAGGPVLFLTRCGQVRRRRAASPLASDSERDWRVAVSVGAAAMQVLRRHAPDPQGWCRECLRLWGLERYPCGPVVGAAAVRRAVGLPDLPARAVGRGLRRGCAGWGWLLW